MGSNKSMIIGVDGGALAIIDDRLKVGVWRVTYNLLKELAKLDTKNEYRIYSFARIQEQFGKNFKNVIVRPKIGWSKISLPIELRVHPVDVFLGLSQMMPSCSAKKIGFVYDLAFLRFPDAYPGSFNKLKRQTEELIKRSDTIVTISQNSKKEIHHPKVIVAYPGVDSIFSPRGERHMEKKPYILMVGSLKRLKNIPEAIRIVKKTPYDLILVGGDYWRDPNIIEDTRVKIIGYISDNELASYYRGACALLITSLWEGFCLPAAEAMACGCPVVHTGAGSIPEVVGSYGQKVEDLMHLKRKSAVQKYSWKSFAQTIYDLF